MQSYESAKGRNIRRIHSIIVDWRVSTLKWQSKRRKYSFSVWERTSSVISNENDRNLNNRLSIGGFYAFILSRNQDVSLSVVARSNYESVEAKVRWRCYKDHTIRTDHCQGLTIESQNHGSHQVKLDQG